MAGRDKSPPETWVLALAGPLGAGKSSLAGALAKHSNSPVLGFGDFVRTQARAQGLSDDRPHLQALGRRLLEARGARALCRNVLTEAGLGFADTPAIWDGVRHLEVLEALRKEYAPTDVYLVFLAPPDPERRQRMVEVTGSAERLEAWEHDETESHLGELRHRADLVVDAASLRDAEELVIGFLRSVTHWGGSE